MSYSNLLRNAIHFKRMSLNEVCVLIHKSGFKTNKAYLSKLQNGKLPPSSDKFNDVLAKILEINPLELRTAAYREKLPADVLERLQEAR